MFGLTLLIVGTIIFNLTYTDGLKPGDQDPVYRLKCPPGQGIQVNGVYWGNERGGCDPKSNFDEHTNFVRSSCDKRPICDVPIVSQLFGTNFSNGTTCVWASLELNIQYKCIPGIETVIAEDGGPVNISCPNDTKIRIVNAYYGRDIHFCPTIPGTTISVSTLYGKYV